MVEEWDDPAFRRTPQVDAALEELRGLIAAGYPDATFEVQQGTDPRGLYLVATFDVADMVDVFPLFIDRMVDIQVDEGLPVYVQIARPMHRLLEEYQARKSA